MTKLLCLDEIAKMMQGERLELLQILGLQFGLCKRIAKSDKWETKTRALAASLMPEILNEIHDLKIEAENERLKGNQVPF